jgi:hypothetical protein
MYIWRYRNDGRRNLLAPKILFYFCKEPQSSLKMVIAADAESYIYIIILLRTIKKEIDIKKLKRQKSP